MIHSRWSHHSVDGLLKRGLQLTLRNPVRTFHCLVAFAGIQAQKLGRNADHQQACNKSTFTWSCARHCEAMR